MSFLQSLLFCYFMKFTLGQMPLCKDLSNTTGGICRKIDEFPNFPTTIYTRLQILEVMRINEDETSLKVYFLMTMAWNDTELELANPVTLLGGEYEVGQDQYEDVLRKKQSIFWVNSLGTGKESTYGTKGFNYFWHRPPHFFRFADVITQKISCAMEFQTFPFDHHECDMIFYNSQHGYSKLIMAPTVVQQGNEETKLGDEEMEIHSQRLPFQITVQSLNTSLVKSMIWLRSGSGIRFRFARNSIGLLLGGYYGPTATFALLSMVSYIIKPEIVPGRMGLLITLFLILTNVYNSVEAPKGRGFSLIEIWLLGTSFPILAAIIEYAYIMNLQNKMNPNMYGKELEDHVGYLKKVDKIAFISCSVYLLIFFLIYWSVALAL